MGDGFYAVFGYEKKDRKRSAHLAVAAAKAILAKLDELNKNYFPVNFNETNIQAGIGIHIGKVVSGTIQIAGQHHMIVMGYPVNIASRLQDATKELNNNLIVSREVFERLIYPPVVPSQTVLVKGIETPITVFLLGNSYSTITPE